ncbi:conserved Plasmodium protein, unknown function [Plasmodium gallinaceum]|uniref:Uncharacterized protein n=1 Tax=Plasmodium gallinaceum TaxID=5849 RepID=A0A1J1GY21_PLAGA|nr:conserved Plasmodium protein, unknown function [Plasmodium gallinaceum]CRG95904.1 conserved Plasmodium protein, unknown function [Plasmodium gallinaceum]
MKENPSISSKFKKTEDELILDSQEGFLKYEIKEKSEFSNENYLKNYAIEESNINLTNNNKDKNESLNEEEKDKQNDIINSQNISNNILIPKVIKKYVNITHKEEVVSYIYTLVSYKNYNIFFITHNGKFASWIYTYNVILPFSVDQETEIIFGERNYPLLEIFCSKFMKDHASLLKYKPIIFALSIYKMSFDDKDILNQIFVNLSNIIK